MGEKTKEGTKMALHKGDRVRIMATVDSQYIGYLEIQELAKSAEKSIVVWPNDASNLEELRKLWLENQPKVAVREMLSKPEVGIFLGWSRRAVGRYISGYDGGNGLSIHKLYRVGVVAILDGTIRYFIPRYALPDDLILVDQREET